MIASAYRKDLGNQGIKNKRADDHATSTNSTAIATLKVTRDEKRRRQLRQERFQDPSSASSETDFAMFAVNRPLSSSRNSSSSNTKTTSGTRKDDLHLRGLIVGENQNLEKPYLRLTTYPRKEDVRPLPVLKRSLEHIQRTYANSEDFEWANEQLKSVRQDLTVQHIRDPFVLECYEIHARILLENGDLNEFNQCQSVLKSLTTSKSMESSDQAPLRQSPTSEDEFKGYGILYALVQKSWGDLQQALIHARKHLRTGQNCRHAFAVWNAVTENNFVAFFRLYNDAPHMSAYLMDFLVKRVRDSAYKSIVSAFRPTVSVQLIQDWLNFVDFTEAKAFLVSKKAAFLDRCVSSNATIDCKNCSTS